MPRTVEFLGKSLLLGLLRKLNRGVRWLAAVGHKLQMRIEWGWPPQPEWFDHTIDLYYQWHQTRNPLWLERGCYTLLALPDRARALEICCGDGFNACHFYSFRASQLVAVDFDSQAIQHARQVNWAPNVEFRVCDIRKEMPEGDFDNIIWDAAIEHFTPAEISTVMQRIKQRLGSCGILSGYTIVEKPEWGKQLSHHEYEFKSKEDLSSFLEPYFRNVRVFETIYPSRHNLYFYASDGVLPFDPAWKSQRVHFRP